MMVWLVCWLAGSPAWVGFGRNWGRNWESIFEKTRVGFGRTEVSVPLDGIVVCTLSSGHGPRGRGFEGISKGVDFHVFVWRYWGSKVTQLETYN